MNDLGREDGWFILNILGLRCPKYIMEMSIGYVDRKYEAKGVVLCKWETGYSITSI